MEIFIIYIAAINIAGFVVMGVDKKRAIRGAWRISEATLFLTAFLGVQHFRHKTKHWYFKYGMPIIFIAETFLFLFLYHMMS